MNGERKNTVPVGGRDGICVRVWAQVGSGAACEVRCVDGSEDVISEASP